MLKIICISIIVAWTAVWAVALGVVGVILVKFIITGGGNG
jgi:hypothetical protein